MKTFKYIFLPFLILATSCYIYKPYVEKENEVIQNTSGKSGENTVSASRPEFERPVKREKDMSEEELQQMKRAEKERTKAEAEAQAGIPKVEPVDPTENTNQSFSKNKSVPATTKKGGINSPDKAPVKTIEAGIKGKLQPSLYYKIEARGNQHKIQVDQWEGDSLVAHVIRRPEKTLKFHKDEINEETILERRFSRPFSDLLTVGAYATVGAAVLLIVL